MHLGFLLSFHGVIAHIFLELSNIPLSEWTTVYPFIYWKNSQLLSSFNNYECSCYKHPCAGLCMSISFQFLLVKCQGVWLLDHIVIACLVWQETARPSFKMVVPYYIPSNNEWEFPFLHNLSALDVVSVLAFGHSDRYVVVFHCFN